MRNKEKNTHRPTLLILVFLCLAISVFFFFGPEALTSAILNPVTR